MEENKMRFGSTSAPVKVGDEIDVTIEAVGAKGDGLARKEGFVLFVPGVQQGDNVRVKVTRVLKKVGFAEVVGKGAAPADAESSEEQEEAPAEEPAEESNDEEFEEGDDSEDFGEDDKKE